VLREITAIRTGSSLSVLSAEKVLMGKSAVAKSQLTAK